MSARKKVVVALVNESQEFQRLQAEDARAAARRLELDTEVVFAESNPVLQIQQLFRWVHAPEESRPAAILVEPMTEEGLGRVARNAARAGISWIVLGLDAEYVTALRTEHPGLAIACVTANHVEIGRIQANQVRALLAGRADAHVLLIQGPVATAAARQRRVGLEEGLSGSQVQLTAVTGDWSEVSGAQAVAHWVRLMSAAQPALVVCQNDAMAAGARNALRRLKPEWADVPLLGVDGLLSGGQQMVRQGLVAATVIVPSNAGPAVELIARYLERGETPPPMLRLEPRSFPPVDQLGPAT